MGFLPVVSVLFLADCLGWALADARLRLARHPAASRLLLAAFMSAMLAYLVLFFFFATLVRSSGSPIPQWVHVVVYVWHVLILGPALLIWAGSRTIGKIVRSICRWVGAPATSRPMGRPVVGAVAPAARPTPPMPAPMPAPPPAIRPTRRQALSAAAAACPPLAALALGAGTVRQLSHWRIRRFAELLIPQLPPQLNGMTIAHVSDTHIGKFLHPDRLPALAHAINALNADFIAFTGDLIDLSLDDLPYGIDFLRSLKSRCGMAICEGNHDVMSDRGEFEDRVRAANLNLLIGDQLTLGFKRDGRDYPVQFLGLPWEITEASTAAAVDFLTPAIRSDAFPILLAHHPHSFDTAASSGLPLVLSGHTHGGQLMLTRDFGAGALRFRYLSGHYQRNGSNLIVSNGLGNWFPVRLNAPAEIVHITLRSLH